MTTLEAQLDTRSRWDETTAAMLRYARSCRNHEKRQYAIGYAAHLLTGREEPQTESFDLSYMGAQAVRLSLGDILRADPFDVQADWDERHA